MLRDYSQNGEQKIILDYFLGYNKGSLLSFGENDGETLSNCRALMLKGWFGVLIEPSPTAFGKLKELYKDHDNCVLVNIAASDYNGKAILYDSGSHLSPKDTSLLSTINPAERSRWKKEIFKEVTVPVEDAKGFNGFNADFISIDAEGEDIKILSRLTLSHCKLLCIEWNSITHNKEMIDRIVIPKGLHLHHMNKENLIYVKQ